MRDLSIADWNWGFLVSGKVLWHYLLEMMINHQHRFFTVLAGKTGPRLMRRAIDFVLNNVYQFGRWTRAKFLVLFKSMQNTWEYLSVHWMIKRTGGKCARYSQNSNDESLWLSGQTVHKLLSICNMNHYIITNQFLEDLDLVFYIRWCQTDVVFLSKGRCWK
jgi:hypothetical protein